MTRTIELVVSNDVELLIPLLHDAEEGDARIAAAIADPANTAYLANGNGDPVGAAVVRWNAAASEIIYVAVAPEQRGHGYGKALMAALIAEAERRQVKALEVGTANAAFDNIAFYQKCGFRIDSVRKDFFDYFETPVYENGIRIRDMLVLRYEVRT